MELKYYRNNKKIEKPVDEFKYKITTWKYILFPCT